MIYKVDLSLTPEQICEVEKSMSEDEKCVFESLDISTFDDIDENGKVISYMIGPPDEFNAIFKYLEQREIVYQASEITSSVLLGEYDFQGTTIETEIDRFLEKNLTVDIVLDKINIKGMECLNLRDKEILSRF